LQGWLPLTPLAVALEAAYACARLAAVDATNRHTHAHTHTNPPPLLS
jgi:hypothetical protein